MQSDESAHFSPLHIAFSTILRFSDPQQIIARLNSLRSIFNIDVLRSPHSFPFRLIRFLSPSPDDPNYAICCAVSGWTRKWRWIFSEINKSIHSFAFKDICEMCYGYCGKKKDIFKQWIFVNRLLFSSNIKADETEYNCHMFFWILRLLLLFCQFFFNLPR